MDYSPITSDLFIGRTPTISDYDHLRSLGVQLVINMRLEHKSQPDRGTPPVRILWLPTFDHPFFPIPIRYLNRGAWAALETIRNGGKVYVHCSAGRHRGVAMGAAVLIAQGYTPQDAMHLISSKRPSADPQAFYIRPRIIKFARQWAQKIKEEKNH